MTVSSNSTPSSASVFPVKLYRLLTDVSNDEGNDEGCQGNSGDAKDYSDVISWSPDGKSFKVHDKERFSEEIMPTYFGSSKYRSFQKNLNMWGFKAARKGECSHPLFIRNSERTVRQMKRQLVNRQKQQRSNLQLEQEHVALLGSHQVAVDAPVAKQLVPAEAASNTTPRRSSLATFEVLRRRSSMPTSAGSAAAAGDAGIPMAAATLLQAAPASTAGDALLSDLLRLRAEASSGFAAPRRISGSSHSGGLEQDAFAVRLLLLAEQQQQQQQQEALLAQQLRNRLNGLALLNELQQLRGVGGLL
mmetsp:Transcript_27479/g.42272  ORF Transcript_27479/g.42272 Transcript_27479/m.42272 type:complete len:304 (+) Transcript_27479:106-1017(+)